MKTVLRSLLAGFVGATTVTLLHEFLRKQYPGMPRLDLLGEEATSKTVKAVGGNPPKGDSLYALSLVGDILSNSLYYSTAGLKKQSPIMSGIGLGLTAGVGAVSLPEKLGLEGKHTGGTLQKKLITVGLYTIGGIVTGIIMRNLADDKDVS